MAPVPFQSQWNSRSTKTYVTAWEQENTQFLKEADKQTPGQLLRADGSFDSFIMLPSMNLNSGQDS